MRTNEVRVGGRFGRLVVQAVYSERGRRKATVKCDCGIVKAVYVYNLGRNTRSCGCLRTEQSAARERTHGMTNTRLYRIWHKMRQRCEAASDPKYRDYGARGIQVRGDWQRFEVFRDWAIGNGYRADLTIDRIDNDRGYEPANCRWATTGQQAQHKRRRRDNRTGYIGVSMVGRRYRARADIAGRQKHLGYFDDPFSAAWVRDKYVRRYGDTFATLNNLVCRRVRQEKIARERRGTFDFTGLGV